MHHIKESRLAVLASFSLGLGALINAAPVAASNLEISATFNSSITRLSNAAAIEAGINAAIANITNDVTTNTPVKVSIDFKNMTTGLGQSVSPQSDIDYSTYLADLQAVSNKTANQITAFATLPKGPYTGISNTTLVALTAANLATLGDTTDAQNLVSGNGGFNSVISLNTSIMNVSSTNTNPDNYALQSVTAHEIDEVLGIGGSGSELYQPGQIPTDISGLDLFRYSATGVRSFTTKSTATAYFSIDSGKTNLVNFNQDSSGDFGDWGNHAGKPQVQDAFGTPGVAPLTLGSNELTALSVVGYSLTPAGLIADGLTAVPLPAAIWFMLSGLLGILGLNRRKAAL